MRGCLNQMFWTCVIEYVNETDRSYCRRYAFPYRRLARRSRFGTDKEKGKHFMTCVSTVVAFKLLNLRQAQDHPDALLSRHLTTAVT